MAGSPIDPSFQYATVTPSDTATLVYHSKPARAKGFYILTTGDLYLADDAGTSVKFTGVLQGAVYPFSSDKVLAATTCTVIALF